MTYLYLQMVHNGHDLVNKSILYITPFAFTGKRFLMTTLRIKLETLMVCSQTMKGQTSMCKFNSDSYLDLFLHKINVGRDIYLRKDDKSVFRSYIFFQHYQFYKAQKGYKMYVSHSVSSFCNIIDGMFIHSW